LAGVEDRVSKVGDISSVIEIVSLPGGRAELVQIGRS